MQLRVRLLLEGPQVAEQLVQDVHWVQYRSSGQILGLSSLGPAQVLVSS
jgi:hypothetical protein